MPCIVLKANRRFEGTYRLYLHGWKISWARNEFESRWQAEWFFTTHGRCLIKMYPWATCPLSLMEKESPLSDPLSLLCCSIRSVTFPFSSCGCLYIFILFLSGLSLNTCTLSGILLRLVMISPCPWELWFCKSYRSGGIVSMRCSSSFKFTTVLNFVLFFWELLVSEFVLGVSEIFLWLVSVFNQTFSLC
jgi:hypothetical protein